MKSLKKMLLMIFLQILIWMKKGKHKDLANLCLKNKNRMHRERWKRSGIINIYPSKRRRKLKDLLTKQLSKNRQTLQK